jgi:hypothetical protein
VADQNSIQSRVDEFILDEIESVPHLEALLLVWNQRPRQWTADDMGRFLYVKPDVADRILNDLAQRNLIATQGSPTKFFYDSSSQQDELLAAVDATYRREVVRISTLIHSKASAAVREFARAFRFTKDKDRK